MLEDCMVRASACLRCGECMLEELHACMHAWGSAWLEECMRLRSVHQPHTLKLDECMFEDAHA